MTKAYYLYVQDQDDQSLTKVDILPRIAYTDFSKAYQSAQRVAQELYQKYREDQPDIEFNEYLEEDKQSYSAEIGESFDVYAEVQVKTLEII